MKLTRTLTTGLGLDQVLDRLRDNPDVRGIALVGSTAGTMSEASDLDLIILRAGAGRH